MVSAEAWTFPGLGICVEPDPETNFPLLRPVRLSPATGNAVLARRGLAVALVARSTAALGEVTDRIRADGDETPPSLIGELLPAVTVPFT